MVQAFALKFNKTLEDLLHSPFALQAISLAFLVFFLTSFRPAHFLGGEVFDQSFGRKVISLPLSETGFIRNSSSINSLATQKITIAADGTKTIQVSRPEREKILDYTIKSGDNISKIAHRFGLKVSTLLWANDLTAKETLQVGKALRIPPVDGIFYEVKKGNTLGEIAKIHKSSLAKIKKHNNIASDVISVGKELFIPDAQKMYIPTKTIVTAPSQGNQTAQPQISSLGLSLIRPTKGSLTQGYHKGHYAVDIANKLNTPIYAAAPGTITKSSSGWNYGYGKYIIVNHGNGIETLYSHMNALKASVGDTVATGQLIGLMGNTGNVYGPTGIHLHFEVRIRGRKVNPFNYF